MKSKMIFSSLALFISLIFCSHIFADIDPNRHSGTYGLDYSHTGEDGAEHDYYVQVNLHGALLYTSSYGNGAVSFSFPTALTDVSDDTIQRINETKRQFHEAFSARVDSLDWKTSWYGIPIYNNWLIPESFLSSADREDEKDTLKATATEYADNVFDSVINAWDAMFTFFPGTVTFETQYVEDVLDPLGLATYYFNDDSDAIWGSGLYHNERVTLPYALAVPSTLYVILPSNTIAGMGCVSWAALDEIGCFSLSEEEPCYPAEDGSCANECTYLGEPVDMVSHTGLIGETTCVGTIPGVIFGLDIGFTLSGTAKGELLPD